MADKPVSVWQCEGCKAVYKSYIPLLDPPYHRCPDKRSIHVRQYNLVEGEPPQRQPKVKKGKKHVSD